MPRKKHIEYITDILEFCEKYNIKSYSTLCDWCSKNKPIWYNTIIEDSIKQNLIIEYFKEKAPEQFKYSKK